MNQHTTKMEEMHLSEEDMALVDSFHPYRANQLALSALQNSSKMNVITTEEQIAFLPSEGASVGLIFYPGARVESDCEYTDNGPRASVK